jgi:hypothetical protein
MSAGPRRYAPRKPTGRKAFNVNLIHCPHLGCTRFFKNRSGLTQHRHAIHGFSSDVPAAAPNPALEEDHTLDVGQHENPLPQTDGLRDNIGYFQDNFEGVEHEYAADMSSNPEPDSDVDEVYRDYHPQLDGKLYSMLLVFMI